MKRPTAALACLAAVLAGVYFLWLRDSSLVRVEEVRVTGLTTAEARDIRAALDESARGMTTLHVDVGELERTVASYPSVVRLETSSDLPHGLSIEVVERRPIAAVDGPEGRTLPVAADGTLLPDFDPDYPLARLPAGSASTTGTLTDAGGLTALRAVEAAPPALARRVQAIERGGEGELTARLRTGPQVLLGDDSDLEAKWAAATAAIAEGGAAGAAYVDVALPERPAVGG